VKLSTIVLYDSSAEEVDFLQNLVVGMLTRIQEVIARGRVA
jgi:hypothetical protein